jgi:iron(III) transport system ATP-binding protein
VLHPTSLQLQAGQRLAIAGEAGSGKTSLLKIIAGLLQPTVGTVHICGQWVEGPATKLIPGHPLIGYLSQHFELRNHYLVADWLDYGSQLTATEQAQLYQLCQIDHLLQRKTNSGLSGGERQRIALAKVLTQRPALLLLDEPFSNLDLLHKQRMKLVLQQLQQAFGFASILVSHDGADVMTWADELLIMRAGQVVQQGPPRQLYARPANEYCAAMLGAYCYFPAGPDGSPLLVRPEQLTLSAQPQPGYYAALIEQVFFEGPTTLLHLRWQQHILWARSPRHHWQAGHTVYLAPQVQPLA